MDASVYPLAFFVAAVLGWLAGRVTRQFNSDMECYDRAFGTGDGCTDRYAQSDAYARTYGDSNRHLDGPAFYLANVRDARRRTILRDYVGDRPGAGSTGGDIHISDETAVK